MKQSMAISLVGILLLSGCYCKKYIRGYSSVRELKVARSYTICYQPPGMKDGKSVLTTVYTSDSYFQYYYFRKKESEGIVSDINFNTNGCYGARLETYWKLGNFPGPLLGIGIDYSQNKFSADYYTSIHKIHEYQTQNIQQQRLLLSFNYVTWIRDRMMGYVSLQPGCEWTKQNIQSEFTKYNLNKSASGIFNLRLAYGFQYYFRPAMAFNLELGYSGGSFLRGGICFWLI